MAAPTLRTALPRASTRTLHPTTSPSHTSLPRPLTRTHLPRPIPNSYWATPGLLACEYPFSPSSPRPKLDALLAAGVRTFVDLTEPTELVHYAPQHLQARAARLGLARADIAYHRFAIPDRALPQAAALAAILSVLRAAAARGETAAVHCRGGIGRTGTVVGCWLVEAGVARDGAHALAIIAEEWKMVEKARRYPCSPETGAQWEFVRNFKKGAGRERAEAVGEVEAEAGDGWMRVAA